MNRGQVREHVIGHDPTMPPTEQLPEVGSAPPKGTDRAVYRNDHSRSGRAGRRGDGVAPVVRRAERAAVVALRQAGVVHDAEPIAVWSSSRGLVVRLGPGAADFALDTLAAVAAAVRGEHGTHGEIVVETAS
jgi:hypothetical protein